MGKTMVEAMQGKSPADCYSVMTSVKHFAAYGAVEGGKEYNTVDMSPQRLFNDYAAVQSGAGRRQRRGDGGAELAERHASHLRFLLLKDVLRDQWALRRHRFRSRCNQRAD